MKLEKNMLVVVTNGKSIEACKIDSISKTKVYIRFNCVMTPFSRESFECIWKSKKAVFCECSKEKWLIIRDKNREDSKELMNSIINPALSKLEAIVNSI